MTTKPARPTSIRSATRSPTKVADDPMRAADLSEILKGVAHPLRLRLVAVLCEGECHVNGLAERLGVSQSLVSQHLATLRLLGLVAPRRVQGRQLYRLAEERLRDLVGCVEGCRTH